MAAPQGQTVVRVQGMPQLRRRINRADRGLRDELKGVHRQVARTVLNASQARTPHRSGQLARTGRASGTLRASIVRYGGARAPYAGPIHYGWPARHIPAQDWVLTAARGTEPVWRARFEAGIRQIVERT